MGSGHEGGAGAPGGGEFYSPLYNPDTGAYRFLVDGEWREDPENPDVAKNEVGRSSVLVVR